MIAVANNNGQSGRGHTPLQTGEVLLLLATPRRPLGEADHRAQGGPLAAHRPSTSDALVAAPRQMLARRAEGKPCHTSAISPWSRTAIDKAALCEVHIMWV